MYSRPAHGGRIRPGMQYTPYPPGGTPVHPLRKTMRRSSFCAHPLTDRTFGFSVEEPPSALNATLKTPDVTGYPHRSSRSPLVLPLLIGRGMRALPAAP